MLGWVGWAWWRPGHANAAGGLAFGTNTCTCPLPPTCLPACLPACSVRNYLYSSWVSRHAYRLHVVCAGLMITVICLVGSGWVGVWD